MKHVSRLQDKKYFAGNSSGGGVAHSTNPPIVILAFIAFLSIGISVINFGSTKSKNVVSDLSTTGGSIPKSHSLATTVNPSTTDTISSTTSVLSSNQLGQGSLGSISCPTSNECITVGSNLGEGEIFYSYNGAQTFKIASIPSNINTLNSVFCSSVTDCISVGNNAIVFSTDSGATWNRSSVSIHNISLSSVTCTTSDYCVSVGQKLGNENSDTGVILSSVNGGQSWSLDNIPSMTPSLNSVVCLTSTTCIAVGGAVVVTDNTGQSWVNREVPEGISSLSSISCMSSLTCIAVGPSSSGMSNGSAQAVAVETTDGGNNFSHINIGAGSAFLESIACSSTNCISIGAGESIKSSTVEFETTNGIDWSEGPIISNNLKLRETNLVNSNQLYLLGSDSSSMAIYESLGQVLRKVG